jgi:hypothetical protein
LHDFRLATQIARNNEKGETDLQCLREKSKSLGKFTWWFFLFQNFFLGEALYVVLSQLAFRCGQSSESTRPPELIAFPDFSCVYGVRK